jgi:restriction system protein
MRCTADGTPETVLVECKRRANQKIDVSIVRSIVGVTLINNATRAVLVTTSSYTTPARSEARRSMKLSLYGYDELKSWLRVSLR